MNIKQDIQLKLQAHLDGELPTAEARAMADLVASDAHARELLTELANTRGALAAHEPDIKVPASRDFYWSAISREIERQEKSPSRPEGSSLFALLRRTLVPVSGLAVVMLAVMLAWQPVRSTGVFSEETETTFADAGAFTYRDYDSGATLVWVDYPAENDFAQIDSDDTLGLD